MRAFRASLGLALYLLVIVTLQPLRDVARGRAAEQLLAASPTPLSAQALPTPNAVVLGTGALVPAPDVRRVGPLEADPSPAALVGAPGVGRARLPPGSFLRTPGGEVPVEGGQVAVAGAPTDYAYGTPIAVYGLWRDPELDVWAAAPDTSDLVAVAQAQTALVRWPGLLLSLLLGAVGFGLACAGAYLLRSALGRQGRPGVRLIAVALALYLLCGYALLGSAWAMLWPTVASLIGGAAGVWWLQRSTTARRPSTAP